MWNVSSLSHLVWKILLLLLPGVGLWMATPTMVFAQDTKDYSAFQKPIFSYLGMEGPALMRLREQQMAVLEQSIRQSIEKGRFLFFKIPLTSIAEGRYVEKMVKLITARSLGIAKMRSTWDEEFQGYAVTTDLLESVQNNSFYYWIEITKFRPYYNRTIRANRFIIEARLHFRQLVIFACTEANRQQGERYQRACRSKSETDYAGFARPFKIVKVEVSDTGVSTSMFTAIVGTTGQRPSSMEVIFKQTAENLGRHLFKEVAQIKQFSLHAPVMRSTFTSVYTNLGKSEGVTVNQGYKIFVRRTNGELLYRGYSRILSVGDNRMKMENGEKVRVDPKAPFLTEARILSVSGGTTLQKGMLMYEHPLLGISLGASVGLAPFSVIGGTASLGIPFPLTDGGVLGINIRLNSEFDLSNATGVPEFYLNVAIDLGIIGSGQAGLVLPVLPAIGVLKKFFFRNIGLVLGARAVVGFVYSDPNTFFMVGGEGIIGMDIFIVPEFTLTLRAGFRGAIAIGVPLMSVGPWFMLGGNYTF